MQIKQERIKKAGLIIGPVASLLIIFLFVPDPENPQVGYTAAIALLMAIWWITEAIPLAITALIPVAFFPLFGIMSGKNVSLLYFNHVIFLFIGGFMVALAMEKWNLHRRIALATLMLFGTNPQRILLGFMVTTWFLSMWVSNTATAMMMVPIALSVIINLENNIGKKKVKKYSVGLLLSIAYSASIGGVATLIGTPPNLVFTRIFSISFPDAPEISFVNWFFFALPISIFFLLLVWLVLSALFCRSDFVISSDIFRNQYNSLEKISWEEKSVLCIFILLALLWLTRADIVLGNFTIPGWSGIFPNPEYITDGVVAIIMAGILYILPGKRAPRIMDWETTKKLPWGIILLFGGGFALAGGFMSSGLSNWIGQQLQGVGSFSPVVIIGLTCTMLTFLTELTSNTGVSEMILPVMAALGTAIGRNPLLLMVPATLASSFAFMMPIATPPNAIIFGTNRIRIPDMVKTGLIINILGIIVLTAGIMLLGGLLNIDPLHMPEWAK